MPEEMQSKKMSGSKAGPPVQNNIDIAEIKEGTVIMNDGSLRSVLMVSSINFALKSEDEQTAVIQAYISFLNSLEHPIQVVVQSRRLNIDSYLQRLHESELKQTNDLLRAQIADYRDFIKELVQMGQIMQKYFFVVVPYSSGANQTKGFFQRLSETLTPLLSVRLADEAFRKNKYELDVRVDRVVANLSSMGLKVARLDTQGLVELYYRVYNPETFDIQKIDESGKLRVEENPANI